MMNNQLPLNRVEIDLAHWNAREARFNKLFSSSTSLSKSLLKEKLAHYENILVKYKANANVEERFALRILRDEKKRLFNELYPNLVVQLIHRLVNVVLIQPIKVKDQVKEVEKNHRFLEMQLQKIGFKDVFNKVEYSLRQGDVKFIVPVSNYVSEKERVDYELHFAKKEDSGYEFEGYKTALYNESKPNESTQHYFKIDKFNSFNTKQAYNLLTGRAIKNEESWLQFDLGDKDSYGNYRLKEFRSEFGYDLENIIKKLPLKELQSISETTKLLNDLEDGARRSVVFLKDGAEFKYYIDANPQFKSINIYDENFKKTTLTTAIGLKTNEIIKPQLKNNEPPKITVAKRHGMHIN